MEKITKIYEGKAKQIFSTEKEDEIVMYYKDDATAFNGLKKTSIETKGILNNQITSIIYRILEKKGIPTHFIKKINDREQLCRRVSIFPLEVIARNILAGSFSKRYGVEEGTIPKNTVYELSYKNDELGDPLLNDHHAVALNLCTYQELETIYDYTKKINEILKEIFLTIGMKLVDFKIEFGKTKDGDIVLADEISPDTCRLWDVKTSQKFDKDIFRRDLGNLIDAYVIILNRLEEYERSI